MTKYTETMHEAARLMRERAEAATPGPWRHVEAESRSMGHVYVVTTQSVPEGKSGYPNLLEADGWSDGRNTTHAASWHPGVALAVADWLDAEADEFGEFAHAAARAVATAYLTEGDSP